METNISYYQYPYVILETMVEIYLQGFRERTRVEDTSANSRKLKIHLLLESYQFLKEGEL